MAGAERTWVVSREMFSGFVRFVNSVVVVE